MKYIYYQYVNNEFLSYKLVEDSYILQDGEYASTTKLLKPSLSNSNLIESITQQEIDDMAEAQLESAAEQVVQKELSDGVTSANKLKVYLQRNLSDFNYKAARLELRGVWESLRLGDWDIALDEITAIDNANSTAISQKIKTHIEAYINN